MEINKITKIIVIVIALVVIGFLSYLIFIKKQVGKAPPGFVQQAQEFKNLTEEEKIDLLKELSEPTQELLKPAEEISLDKEKKAILDKLSVPASKDISIEEKFKILESLK